MWSLLFWKCLLLVIAVASSHVPNIVFCLIYCTWFDMFTALRGIADWSVFITVFPIVIAPPLIVVCLPSMIPVLKSGLCGIFVGSMISLLGGTFMSSASDILKTECFFFDLLCLSLFYDFIYL